MEFDFSKLTGRIIEKFGSRRAFADAMGMRAEQLSRRLSSRTPWSPVETVRAIEILEIDPIEISDYFFTVKVR